MGRLENKVAIITGSARGMGAAHAKKFIQEGAKVVLTDLNEELGKAMEKKLGANAKFVKQNVTKEEDWINVVKEAEATFGPVNVLVNNAGIEITKPFKDTTLDEYRKVIEVNEIGVFLGMKTVLNSMIKAGGGSIINISSVAGFMASKNLSGFKKKPLDR